VRGCVTGWDGIDDGRAQGSDEGDRDPLQTGEQDWYDQDYGRIVRHHSWHRDHARKALRGALRPQVVKPRAPRPPKYGPKVIAALVLCWATPGMETGKWLSPILPELVAILRRSANYR
jgi:hypothetical protein